MTNKIGQQLQQIQDRLETMETKLQRTEGALSQTPNLEKSANKIQVSIVSFNEKVKKMDDTIQDLDAGLTSLNADIEEMQNREKQNLGKIKDLQDQILYQNVYSRRGNLRCFGLPETDHSSENTSDVVYRFFEHELELENASKMEFQRVHRLGKRKAGQSRPIIIRL